MADSRQRREVTYDVRVWSVSKVGRTHRLRWRVAGRPRSEYFATAALADSQRSQLLLAARRGEPFDVETGKPMSMLVQEDDISCWAWVLEYVDLKWPRLAPNSRRSAAEALTDITLMLTGDRPGRPPEAELRRAVRQWACNARTRTTDVPADLAAAVSWLEAGTLRLSVLNDRPTMRRVLSGLEINANGTAAAATTVARKRAVLNNMLELAVERGIFESNPIRRVKWTAPKASSTFDPRAVVNPTQARRLLNALDDLPTQGRGHRSAFAIKARGRKLKAFFAAQYYCALRPSEAMALTRDMLQLPDGGGWGTILLSAGDPETSGAWTDTGTREPRQLKHRARGTVRPVPCPPAMTELFRRHLIEYAIGSTGPLFRGQHGGHITTADYNEVWRMTRSAALAEAEAASPLAARPYDLRHTAVSTWLAGGVDSAQVAQWAGHSVAVLHRVYAHVLSGREHMARQQIDRILDEG